MFLPGWPSIQGLLWVLRQEPEITAIFDLLPLHSQIPPEVGYISITFDNSFYCQDQQKVFQKPPPGRRKCILSTNIAETSLTIEDAVRLWLIVHLSAGIPSIRFISLIRVSAS